MIDIPGLARPVGIVVCDLDRTLTDRRLRVVPRALRQLARLRRRGLRIVLATGRPERDLQRRPRMLTHFDAHVSEGGGLLSIRGTTRPLKPGVASFADLRSWLRRHRIPHHAGVASLSIPRRDAPRLQTYPRLRAFSLVPNRDRLDVTLRGATKGTALRALRAGRRLGPGAVLAFADGENDLEWFRRADYRVAVANAVPPIKRAAHIVTRAYGGRGVADFLARLLNGGPPQ